MSDLEFHLLQDWQVLFRDLLPDSKADIIIYLKTSPATAYTRIQGRNRDGEMNITLEYLNALHDAHEKWLRTEELQPKGPKIFILDANSDLNSITNEYERVLKEVEGLIEL